MESPAGPEPSVPVPASSPKPRRTLTLVALIVIQVLTVLFIAASVGVGIFFGLVGSGWAAGGAPNWFEGSLYLPLLLLIPMIITWVIYKKKSNVAVTLTVVSLVLSLCPALIIFLMITGFIVP